MNLTIEDISETRKNFIVSVSAQETADEEKQLIQEFTHQLNIPGFRPGKAPGSLIRKRYAKELGERLKNKLSIKAYEQAIQESGMDIYSIVAVEEGNFKLKEEGEIRFTVDINPSFDLPAYKGISTEVLSTEVTEREIDSVIDEMRQQRAQFEVVKRAAEKGDFVKVSYEGTIDGRAIAEIIPQKPIWGKQENTWEEAGAEESPGVKAVVDGLVSMQVGDQKEVAMEFPAAFEISELAGKKATYTVEVHEVRERVLPELTEDFLKSFQAETLEQLKEQITRNLKNDKQQKNRASQKRQVSDVLSERVQFPLAQSAIEEETETIMRELVTLNLRRGLPESELENYKEEIFEKSRQAAVGRVKMNTILSRIAEEEKIAVQNEDIQGYLLAQAYATGTRPEQLVQELKNDQKKIQSIRQALMRDKALDLVLHESVVTVKKD